MRRALLCLAAVVCASLASFGTPVTNVAPLGVVTLQSGSTHGSPLQSIVSAQWIGTWDGGLCWEDRTTVIRIDLPHTYELIGIYLQAHEDDAFQIDYLYQGTWNPLWIAPQTVAANFRALENVAQTLRWQTFEGTFAEAVRISALPTLAYDARESFGIGTIQIWATPAATEPEPSPLWLTLTGFAFLRWCVGRRRSKVVIP